MRAFVLHHQILALWLGVLLINVSVIGAVLCVGGTARDNFPIRTMPDTWRLRRVSRRSRARESMIPYRRPTKRRMNVPLDVRRTGCSSWPASMVSSSRWSRYRRARHAARPPSGGERATPLLPTRHALPWFIIFSNVVILALGIIYTVATILNPPNW